MPALLVIVALGAVVLVVAWPFLRTGEARAAVKDAAEIDALLAERESTYRQIRELEMDHRTGKLERDDFRVQDRKLRAQAVELLRRLDELGVAEQPAAPAAEAQEQTAPATLSRP